MDILKVLSRLILQQKALVINGTTVFVISANSPEEPDYTYYGIKDALVIDNTGAFRTEEALSRHLEARGVDKGFTNCPWSRQCSKYCIRCKSEQVRSG